MAFGEGVKRGLRRAKAAVVKTGGVACIRAGEGGSNACCLPPAARPRPAADLPERTWSKRVVTAPAREEADMEQQAAGSRGT